MTPQDCIRLFGVIGTWAIAILAVFGEKLRLWLFRPSLQLDLLDPEGEFIRQSFNQRDANTGQWREVDRKPTRYYHVKLSNGRKFRFFAAHEAQVLIIRVESPGIDGLPEVIHSTPVPLFWQNAAIYPSSRTVGPEAIADLLYVREDRLLCLTTVIRPNNFPGVQSSPAKLWVTLQARSVEADSKELRVEINWDGQWDPGKAEMMRHLKVSVPPTSQAKKR